MYFSVLMLEYTFSEAETPRCDLTQATMAYYNGILSKLSRRGNNMVERVPSGMRPTRL